jgi:hypothetical protein
MKNPESVRLLLDAGTDLNAFPTLAGPKRWRRHNRIRRR